MNATSQSTLKSTSTHGFWRDGLRITWLASALLLALGLLSPNERFLRAMRNPDPNRDDLQTRAGGYYVGLINGGVESDGDSGALASSQTKPLWGDLSALLVGKPANWVRFIDAGVATPEPKNFLQFQLKPNASRSLYGHQFSTNKYAMRDRSHEIAKPRGAYRIALLGSSIDMGWGVADEDVYKNRLENWLNHQARKRKLKQQFEILNFAVAAYGPAQRLEVFRRQVLSFKPDLVIYSVTMLDTRLAEIHLRGLLAQGLDLQYDFLREAAIKSRLMTVKTKKGREVVQDKGGSQSDIDEACWHIANHALGEIQTLCQSANIPLWVIIVPRVGPADAPQIRANSVNRYQLMAKQYELPIVDLSGTFDNRNRADMEIAAWDDHPNADGHRLLFQNLAKALVADPILARTLFQDSIPSIAVGTEGTSR